MPLQLGQGNCQYTPISTAGTTTLNPGQAGPLAASSGVLYGVSQLSAGTGYAFTVLDLIPGNLAQLNAGTATITNTLLNGTGSANQNFPAGIQGVGVRYKGALVVITAGTPGAINALWD